MKKTLAAIMMLAALAANADDGPVRAEKWMVASGHELASEAGREVLRNGGNAFDAAVATAMALNVTRFFSAGMVGVAPTLVYDAKAGTVQGYVGLGTAPAMTCTTGCCNRSASAWSAAFSVPRTAARTLRKTSPVRSPSAMPATTTCVPGSQSSATSAASPSLRCRTHHPSTRPHPTLSISPASVP